MRHSLNIPIKNIWCLALGTFCDTHHQLYWVLGTFCFSTPHEVLCTSQVQKVTSASLHQLLTIINKLHDR